MAIKNLGTEDKPQYEVRVAIRTPTGWRTKRKRGIKTIREAKSVEHILYTEISNADSGLNHQILFPSLVEEWGHQMASSTQYSPGTCQRYMYSLERGACLAWADRSVSSISESDVRQFLDSYCSSRNLSQNTRASIKKMIASVFRYAVQKGILSKSPCDNIRIREVSPELSIWSLSQLQQFLSGVRKLNTDWYHIFALASLTGMRSGELTALRWENVDLPGKVIKVCESYDAHTGLTGPTKSKLIRSVPINNALKSLIEAIRLKQKGDVSQNTSRGFVLPRIQELLKGHQATILKSYAKLLGLPLIRFHDLRAIFACQLALSGVPMHVIKSICGWSNLQTVQRYMRLSGHEIKGATDNLKIKI